jgi:2-aminoadipate transaminase
LGWRWTVPAGGLYLWLTAPAALDTGLDSAFCRACVQAGVLYVPGELCFGDTAPKNFVRLSFGVLGVADLAEAGRRFAAVAQRFA